MSNITPAQRAQMRDDDFGIPEKRLYPLHDREHVESAVRLFGKADVKYKKELARRILRRAKSYNMNTSGWTQIHQFAQEQVPPMSNGTSIGNTPPLTMAPYYEYTMREYQEGVFQDIKNGVNPYSDKIVFHVTSQSYYDGQIFKPRVPSYLDPYDPEDNFFEDNTTPRISFSTSIEGALNGIMCQMERDTPERFDKMYVYIPEKPLSEYKHKTTKQLVADKKVWDANVTREVWIMEPVRMKLYGTIRVDQIKRMTRKQTVRNVKNEKHDRPYFTFKWHWIVAPDVLEKSSKFDYSPERVIRDLCIGLKKFKYGLIKDGRVQTNASDADYDRYWVFRSGLEVDQAGGGNCYDMVEYETGYMETYGITSFKKYYMTATTKKNKMLGTHTFCVVPMNGKFTYIEQAFKRVIDEWGHERRKSFDTLHDVFEYVAECMADYHGQQINFGVWDYTNAKIDYGTPIKEFQSYIMDKCKMIYDGEADKPKVTKEGYMMTPSRFFQEEDETITVGDVKLDTEDVSENDHTEEEIESTETDYDVDQIDLGKFGSDTSDIQNDYDQKEVELLLKLMSSEAQAMDEYMDGAKETNVDVLRRLYADIANEERFHMEQLLFAKSQLTGEKYDPRDPDVRKEYEELLDMGMDEETAMQTAVDKCHIRGSIQNDTYDETEDELIEDIQITEMAIMQLNTRFNSIIATMESSGMSQSDLNDMVHTYTEQCLFMESIDQPNQQPSGGNWVSKYNGIVNLLVNTIKAIIRLIDKLIRQFTKLFTKLRARYRNMKKTIRVNGNTWRALFRDGVKFYLIDPTLTFDPSNVISPDTISYIYTIRQLAFLCSKQLNLTSPNIQEPFQYAPSNLRIQKFRSIQEGIRVVENTHILRTKYTINDQVGSWLNHLFFDDDSVRKQDGTRTNLFKEMQTRFDMWKNVLEGMQTILEEMKNMKNVSNQDLYKESMDGIKVCVKGSQAFVNAFGEDITELTRIGQGLLKETESKTDKENK